MVYGNGVVWYLGRRNKEIRRINNVLRLQVL